jgi:hypothetical protein
VDAAGLDYREHVKRWGDHLSFVGVLDLDPLIRLEPEEVEAYVKNVVLDMKQSRRYIAGTITAIDEIPVENYVTMVNTIHRHGAY